MAKSSKKKAAEISTPTTEFKMVMEPATAEDAFAAIEDKREGVLFRVPFDAIHPIADFNIRVRTPDYETHIDRIAQSIKDNGFFQHMPLKVHPVTENGQNLLYLVGGYSRYEAAKRAVANGVKLSRLPVVATPKGTTLDDLLIGLDKDNDGKPLTPFERGILVKRMLANDNSEEEIAESLGVTKRYVSDLLGLMAAPKALHNMVVSGEVSAALAMDMIQEHGGEKAVEILKSVGATGEKPAAVAAGGGEAAPATPAPVNRVTRSQVAKAGGTQKAGLKLYQALVEYLIVLNSQNGPQTAMDFLIKWQEKDPDTVKELAKIAKPGKKGKKAEKKAKKEKNPKDVRQKITDDMTDEQKAAARAHNKEVKKRKERREKRLAAKAAEATATTATTTTEEDETI